MKWYWVDYAARLDGDQIVPYVRTASGDHPPTGVERAYRSEQAAVDAYIRRCAHDLMRAEFAVSAARKRIRVALATFGYEETP